MTVVREHDVVVIETDDVTNALHTLTSWAIDHHVELDGITVTRPSLEEPRHT